MASLTRAQWEQMWYDIKQLELLANGLNSMPHTRQRLLQHIEKMKILIQDVIGQME